jgi:phosphoribosylanthranilate isomerase
MLKTKVKASSITNLTDARYFAAMGVEWLGFNLNSRNAPVVPFENISEIEAWVEGVKIVVEYGDEFWDKVLEGVQEVIPDIVQIGGDYGVAEILELPPSVGVIKEIIIGADTSMDSLLEQMEEMEGHVEAFSINFIENQIGWQQLEAGIPFSVKHLEQMIKRFPVLVDMDLQPEDLPKCLALEKLEGITVKGGEEEKVGFKSFEELDDFFDALMD